MEKEPIFLTLDDVLAIHANQLELYGGSSGLRDRDALLSALEAPRWAFHYGQADIVDLAAVYFYHLMMNHPFVDGNKRVGTAATFVFFDFQGYWVEIPDEKLEELALQVAGGQLDKEKVAPRLRPFVVTPQAGDLS